MSLGEEGETQFENAYGKVLEKTPEAAPPCAVAEGDSWVAVATDDLRPLDWVSIAEAFIF